MILIRSCSLTGLSRPLPGPLCSASFVKVWHSLVGVHVWPNQGNTETKQRGEMAAV
jgi:hypothetical protein